jgi:DNA-binding transcriptional ArsR family regulator
MESNSYGLYNRLDATFAALADPTRRAILARLASGEASVAELAAPFDMTQPAISKHLRVLERAGLISQGRDAQRRPRRLEAKPLAQASAWLERYREFWEERFQQLDALLVEMQGVDSKSVDLKGKEKQSSRHSSATKAASKAGRGDTAKAVPFPKLTSDPKSTSSPKSTSNRRGDPQ